jgi:large subunit ribosomal protein L7/L12
VADDDDEAQLLAAIAADPEDAQAREVYADWLDKRGDARGEYIRLEAMFHAIPPRLAQLTAALDPAWLAKVGRLYDVVLVEAGANKIGVIKLVREHTGRGLKDAKDIVDDIVRRPHRVVTDVERDVARKVVEVYKQAGAVAQAAPRGETPIVRPAPRGVQVVLVSINPDQRLPAMQLVRELRSCGIREALRLVDKVIAGTPSELVSRATVESARDVIAMFASVGTVECKPG